MGGENPNQIHSLCQHACEGSVEVLDETIGLWVISRTLDFLHT